MNLADGVNPLVEVPDMPKHLSREARKEWKRITPLLVEEGLIARMDRSLLALYCQAWGRMAELEAAMNAKIETRVRDHGMSYEAAVEYCFYDVTPKGFTQQAALVNLIRAQAEAVARYAGHFGMSPSQRARITPSSNQPQLPGLEAPAAAGWGRFQK
ncbi:phage terminase small subunit P27 family [Cupriavidus sp. YAF13]|uniref:phage terminase small subunit P27 family n=1 Tax=Cupriavidus sp. YAF13 TaxID=3233075 RepID=UPI003F914B3F